MSNVIRTKRGRFSPSNLNFLPRYKDFDFSLRIQFLAVVGLLLLLSAFDFTPANEPVFAIQLFCSIAVLPDENKAPLS